MGKLLKETNIKTFLFQHHKTSIKNFLIRKKIKLINIDKLKIKKNLSNFNSNSFKISKISTKLIVNSSGTTGQPKKIIIDINRLWKSGKKFTSNYKFLNSKNTFYNILPMSYLGGLFNLGLIPLSLGATVVIDKQFSGNTFLNFWNKIRQYNIDILWLVPSIIRGLLKISKQVRKNYKNYKVFPKACFLGTAISYKKENKLFEKKFGIPIYENYGTSETTFICLESNFSKKLKKNNIGKLISNINVKIVDSTLRIKSPYNFLGYYQKDKECSQNKDIFYDTGDVCSIVEKKYLIFKGRKKEIIKKGGLLIVLQEINNIFQSHKSVVESYALPVKHEFYGEDYVIFFTCKSKKKINYISDSFREKVPRYKWPQEIKLVNKIEKTASGKVDLRKLQNKL